MPHIATRSDSRADTSSTGTVVGMAPAFCLNNSLINGYDVA